MAYQTGTAGSILDLLDKLRRFGESAGWTTTAYNATTWAFSSSTGGNFTLRQGAAPNGVDTLNLYGSTANIPGVLEPRAHPDESVGYAPVNSTQPAFDPASGGPYTRYHFFGTPQYLHVVLEVQAGAFAHMHIGTLDKRGMEYVGGEYLQAQKWRYAHNDIRRVDQNPTGNFTNVYTPPMYQRGSANRVRVGGFDGLPAVSWNYNIRGLGKGPFSQMHFDWALAAACRCEYMRKPIIVPNRILLDASPRRIRMLGQTPDFGITDIGRNAPGDIIVFGEDEWMVFPIYRKGPEMYNYSMNAAFAYLLRK